MFCAPMLEPSQMTGAAVAGLVARHGLVFFENLSETALGDIMDALGSRMAHPDSGADGATRLHAPSGANVPALTGEQRGFSRRSLYPHTDRSSTPGPPPLLVFWCDKPSRIGGDSVFADGLRIWKVLNHTRPDSLAVLESPDNFLFSYQDSVWRSPVFERHSPSRRSVRFRGDNLLYANSGAWPPLRVFAQTLEANTVRLKLGAGQGYIVQNSRWLHGRTRFFGERTCRRVLIAPHAQFGDTFNAFEVAERPSCTG